MKRIYKNRRDEKASRFIQQAFADYCMTIRMNGMDSEAARQSRAYYQACVDTIQCLGGACYHEYIGQSDEYLDANKHIHKVVLKKGKDND